MELERQVESRTLEIKQQKDQLERLDHSKNQLFKSISHELRTPLSLVWLSSQDLLEEIPAKIPPAWFDVNPSLVSSSLP